MSVNFVARPLMATAGWAAQAAGRGLKVTHRPTHFGRMEYLVKDGAAVVRFKQAQESRLAGVVDEPTLAQLIVLKQLAKVGVLEITGGSSAQSLDALAT